MKKPEPITHSRHLAAKLALGRALNEVIAMGISNENVRYLEDINQSLRANVAQIDNEIRRIKADRQY